MLTTELRFRCAALCRRVPTPGARMLAAAVRDCQEPPNVAEWVEAGGHLENVG